MHTPLLHPSVYVGACVHVYVHVHVHVNVHVHACAHVDAAVHAECMRVCMVRACYLMSAREGGPCKCVRISKHTAGMFVACDCAVSRR